MANRNAAGQDASSPFGPIIALGIGVVLVLFWMKFNRSPSSPLLGKTAPDFTFKWPDGKDASLSGLKGKTVLINFWASWCEPCMDEMPSLQNLENKLEVEKEPFVLLAVNLDGVDDPSNHERMPKNLIFKYSRESMEPYQLNAVPVSVLVNPRGVVQHIYFGARNWVDLGILSQIHSAR